MDEMKQSFRASWLVLEEIQGIMQALVGLLGPGTVPVCVPAPRGCPRGHCPGELQSCWHHTRKLGGIIAELLVEHCAPHPAMEQFQDWIPSPLRGVQAPSVLLSTWVLLIRRNMLGKSVYYYYFL